MTNIIVIAVIVLVVGSAAAYVIRAKRNGKRTVGINRPGKNGSLRETVGGNGLKTRFQLIAFSASFQKKNIFVCRRHSGIGKRTAACTERTCRIAQKYQR